jgi:hypothetical protein
MTVSGGYRQFPRIHIHKSGSALVIEAALDRGRPNGPTAEV